MDQEQWGNVIAFIVALIGGALILAIPFLAST